MSCATHRLDGGMAMTVNIYDSNGELVERIEG